MFGQVYLPVHSFKLINWISINLLPEYRLLTIWHKTLMEIIWVLILASNAPKKFCFIEEKDSLGL